MRPTHPRLTTPSCRPARSPPTTSHAYAGSYGNDYYGPLVVSAEGGKLSMTMGRKRSQRLSR